MYQGSSHSGYSRGRRPAAGRRRRRLAAGRPPAGRHRQAATGV